MANILVMKNTKNLFKINLATYFLILTFLFTGLIKNIILIYLIIIIHELGHIWIIKKLKYKVLRVDIYPMGGVTTIDKKINTSIKQELLISIFGIIFQILLGIIFYFLYYLNTLSSNTYNLFTSYNKTILLFNLLPIVPLDGHVFLRSLLEIFFSFKKSFYISIIISLLGIIFFITYNEIFSLNNYLIISFLIFKIMTTLKEFKYIYLRFLTERHLYQFPYRQIQYENGININVLKKETYHYFKSKDKIYSETQVLAKKFKN